MTARAGPWLPPVSGGARYLTLCGALGGTVVAAGSQGVCGRIRTIHTHRTIDWDITTSHVTLELFPPPSLRIYSLPATQAQTPNVWAHPSHQGVVYILVFRASRNIGIPPSAAITSEGSYCHTALTLRLSLCAYLERSATLKACGRSAGTWSFKMLRFRPKRKQAIHYMPRRRASASGARERRCQVCSGASVRNSALRQSYIQDSPVLAQHYQSTKMQSHSSCCHERIMVQLQPAHGCRTPSHVCVPFHLTGCWLSSCTGLSIDNVA